MPSYPYVPPYRAPIVEPYQSRVQLQLQRKREAEAALAATKLKFERSSRYLVSVNTAQSLIAAGQMAPAMSLSAVGGLAEALLSKGIPESVMQRVNEEICIEAQKSAFQGFIGRRPRRNPALNRLYPLLRTNNASTRASGALRRAIMKPEFFHATARRVQFINMDLLSQEASHWKRLNYGAGAGAIAPPGRFELKVDGLLVAAVGLDPDPQPAFGLPRGFFLGPTGVRQPAGTPGTGVFIPTRGPQRGFTRGIVTTNFLDAGVKSLLSQMGTRYTKLMRDVVEAPLQGDARMIGAVEVPVVKVQAAGGSLPGPLRAVGRPDLSPRIKAELNRNLQRFIASGRYERELIISAPVRRVKLPDFSV